jgi:hypothetical protein
VSSEDKKEKEKHEKGNAAWALPGLFVPVMKLQDLGLVC